MSKPSRVHDSTKPYDDLSTQSGSGSIGSTDGLTDVLYLKQPGSADPVSMGDINQGELGDCYFLAPLGEIARQSVIQDNLHFIPSIIQANNNGTETVKLYKSAGAGFSPVYETVTNVFSSEAVNSGFAQAAFGNQKEIWPQVIEKAYAQLNGGYAAIGNGGQAVLAMEALTGKAASRISPDGFTLKELTSLTSEHDLLVFDTSAAPDLPNGLLSWHSYMFGGLSGTGPATMVSLRNPWGFDQPPLIPLSQIASGKAGIVGIDIGHFTA